MSDAVHDKERLRELQALPLERKILITQTRIIEWYTHYEGKVYVSFSGGKDSTVLLTIARQCFPDIEAMFVDTGLEFPEIKRFVKTFENVTIVRPEMRFDKVLASYGYPVISKEVCDNVVGARNSLIKGNTNSYRLRKLRGELLDESGNLSKYNCPKYEHLLNVDFKVSPKCCDVMKKQPAKRFEKQTGKHPITAQMAVESMLRRSVWLRNGCNAFDAKRPMSNPMSFWTEQDVLEYIGRYNIPIASVYGEVKTNEEGKYFTTGYARTGCIFCAYGAHCERGETRFQSLSRSHPKQYDYCINGGEYNEDGSWQPNKEGLGMGHVFDELNSIYGEDFIKYK